MIFRYNFLTAAERFIGAFRFIGKDKMADDLKAGLLSVGVKVKEIKPPHALRIQAMWANLREWVIANFPKAPAKPKSVAASPTP